MPRALSCFAIKQRRGRSEECQGTRRLLGVYSQPLSQHAETAHFTRRFAHSGRGNGVFLWETATLPPGIFFAHPPGRFVIAGFFWPGISSKEAFHTVLSRRVGESIVIDDHFQVTVIDIHRGKMCLGITAPESVRIDREEVHERRQEFRATAETASCPELHFQGVA